MKTLNDFLPEFREIVSAQEDWPAMTGELQVQAAEEIKRMGLDQQDLYADVYGLVEAVPFIVQDTHTRFRRCVDLQPPPERILCAPVSVKDKVISLACSSDFFYWACHKAKNLTMDYDEFRQTLAQGNAEAIGIYTEFIEDAVAKSKNPSVEKEVHEFSELIAAIIRAFPESIKGLKPIVDRSLEKGVEEYIERIREEKTPPRILFRETLGGASAIIADTMAELRQRDVWVYTTYNSNEQSQLYKRFAWWWDPQHGQTNDPVRDSGHQDHPIRRSYIFEFDQGLMITDAQDNPIFDAQGKPIQAERKDRVVFRIPPHVGSRHLNGATWAKAVLEDEYEDWDTSLAVEGNDEWPSVPGFVRIYVDNKETLRICFLGQERLQQISRDYHYVVLAGVGLGTFQCPESALLAHALAGQLEVLAGGHTRLHLELSGGIKKGGRLMPFARTIRNTIRSVGLNDEELAAIARLSDFPLSEQDVPTEAGSIYRRYLQAKALAEALYLDRLYVHGNKVDLILRKNATPGIMRQEIEADLFVKGLVVLAIFKRSFNADWVMKARELEETELTLAKEGFWVLLRFALDLYKEEHWSVEELEAFTRNGYCCDRSPGAYSLAIVPVMWPRLPENIISTGAGDICSGITVVYAGY
jgi:ADP-dependent phosphofructokinase/glucokinase